MRAQKDRNTASVKLYLEEGYQVKDIARELGIGKSSLGKWIREYREKGANAFTSPPEPSAVDMGKPDSSREFVRMQILEHLEKRRSRLNYGNMRIFGLSAERS